MTTKLLGCVVAYHPDPQFPDRIRSIAAQVDGLLVVDNSENASLTLTDLPDAQLYPNKNRGGIAGALNQALDHGHRNGYTHVALFDHDSVVPEGMLPALVAHLEQAAGTLIAPAYVNSATGNPGRFVTDENGRPKSQWIGDNRGVVKAFILITSGTVIALERLSPSIRYDEQLQLDMVDVEFCLRVRHSGGTALLDTSQVMQHGIGNRADGASRFAPPQYSPGRFSSVIRNRVTIWRRWRKIYPRFVAQDVLVAFLDFLRNLTLLSKRGVYLRAVYSGIRQGLRQK